MEEEQGVAAFKSFPGEGFRFGVRRVDGVGHIWLENQVSKQRWACDLVDVAAFAPTDVVLPQNTVLHYVVGSLKESVASPDSANLGPNLVREDKDETLQLEVMIKLGVADFAWTPKYVFPMTLLPQEPPPAEAQSSEQITLLTAQVQELQQEVKTLKEQMAAVLSARAASQQTPTPSSPSQASTASSQSSESVPVSVGDTTENEVPVPILSRKDQVWGDIIGHPCHQLVQTAEFRETRNSVGVVVRKHRQHSCKVCSALRGDRKRPFQTSYYCEECTKQHNGGMVFLCDKVRLHGAAEYRNATCSQIWHLVWSSGEDIPQSGTSSIRMRKKLKTSSADESRPSCEAKS